ncbi:hypothetical protein SUDANB15_07667 (plasmid) [Streptomyces sp. enrichment culture]
MGATNTRSAMNEKGAVELICPATGRGPFDGEV